MGAEGFEIFEVGPCEDAYTMVYLIGQRFSNKIKSRLASDLILQDQLLPFAQTTESQPLIQSLTENHRSKFPRLWDELVGTADGSGVPVLEIMLINFRKEILPFIPKTVQSMLLKPVSREIKFRPIPPATISLSDGGTEFNVHVKVHDENSLTTQRKATTLPKGSKEDVLSLLGDTDESTYPIYMTGPTLCTVCTAVIDLNEQTLSILEGNPKNREISHIFSTCSEDFKMPLQKLKV
ncbi:uncharacterized protein LOC126795405 [Argentina anserina]|uniref:uncharacterized protein LOC126795405 n=1 Tax=Argentina anserina TaxID=57926 RepID=UPI0021768AC1|nr:uncharacterized protein LOC126795405 [Potentilla anserina]